MNQSPIDDGKIHLKINGKEITVPRGITVYNAAKQSGIDIPIFCYQDRMPPFGACRMCLVEVEKMTKLQTSCTLEATEGMVVWTNSEKASKGHEEILELLLINHPLDCPICDKGGECPLQDQTMKFGPGKSHFYEEKRQLKKHLKLSPVLTLDRERCVMCARCTRFGEIVAGDNALEIIDRGYRSEIGSTNEEMGNSKFIGNTIMICPVGALTSSVYRFRARPWDNDSTPSTCTLCPVGCSMIWDARDGEIMRTRSFENHDVNDIWMCDKGWFGYEFTNHAERLSHPKIRKNGVLVDCSWNEAFNVVVNKITEFRKKGRIAAFGGNPLTFEENVLFQNLMRNGAFTPHIDHRMGQAIFSEDFENLPSQMEISLNQCGKLDYACLLGVDITEEYPVLWLRLKQGTNQRLKLFSSGFYRTEACEHAVSSCIHSPLETLKIIRVQIDRIKQFLVDENKKGAVFVGQQYLSSSAREAVLSELVKLKKEYPHLSLNFLTTRENSRAAEIAGMRPDFGFMGMKLDSIGLDALNVLKKSALEGWDFLYVAGANPSTHFPSDLWNNARERLQFMVVQDLFLTETAKEADVLLPVLSYAEKGGSFINLAGNIQKVSPGKTIPHGLYTDGEIFSIIAHKLGLNSSSQSFDLSLATLPEFRFNLAEAKVDSSSNQDTSQGLLSCFAPRLFDRGVRMRHNPHLLQLSPEPFVRIHSKEGQRFGVANNEIAKLIVREREIKAKIVWDDRVAEGVIWLPMGYPELPVQNLGLHWMNGKSVGIKSTVR